MHRSCGSREEVYWKLMNELEKSGIGRSELLMIRLSPAAPGIYGLSQSVTIRDYDHIIMLLGMVRQNTAAKCQRELEEKIRLELTQKVVAALSAPTTMDISEH